MLVLPFSEFVKLLVGATSNSRSFVRLSLDVHHDLHVLRSTVVPDQVHSLNSIPAYVRHHELLLKKIYGDTILYFFNK